jgi:TonB-dependent SusC/RagA subfamily outer membrane receptor
MRLQAAALAGPIRSCDQEPQASVVTTVKGKVRMRYEMVVRRCGAVVILGLAACGPSMANGEAGGAQPRDSVAVGYGAQAPTNVTGSVSSIDPGQNKGYYRSMVDYLQGRVAGLQVVLLPNGNVQLVVRGVSTFGPNGDNSALLVVDNTPIPLDGVGGQLTLLRPEDVVRVDVLKDASAAIYGSRGANGVVIITTRHGR